MPSAVDREEDLVVANSRLAVLGVVAGFAIAAPGAVLLKVPFLGGDWVLRLAALVFACATVAAFRLRSVADDAPRPVADERQQLRAAGIRLAASAMAVLRGIVGFLTFLVTFGFRQAAGSPRSGSAWCSCRASWARSSATFSRPAFAGSCRKSAC